MVSSRRSTASSAVPNRYSGRVRRSTRVGYRPRRDDVPSRAEGWYGFFLDLDRTREALDELARLHDDIERPAELGSLEITITPPPGPIDVDTVRQFEELGVHRLVLMREFLDMADGPVAATRAAILDDLADIARRFGLS